MYDRTMSGVTSISFAISAFDMPDCFNRYAISLLAMDAALMFGRMIVFEIPYLEQTSSIISELLIVEVLTIPCAIC